MTLARARTNSACKIILILHLAIAFLLDIFFIFLAFCPAGWPGTDNAHIIASVCVRDNQQLSLVSVAHCNKPSFCN
jgi:hypothetical protein